MTDLDRKLEEIAQKFYKSDCQCDECIRELVQATTEATARYCAEIAEKWGGNYPKDLFVPPTSERARADLDAGFVPDVYSAESARNSSRQIRAAILRECGVKE